MNALIFRRPFYVSQLEVSCQCPQPPAPPAAGTPPPQNLPPLSMPPPDTPPTRTPPHSIPPPTFQPPQNNPPIGASPPSPLSATPPAPSGCRPVSVVSDACPALTTDTGERAGTVCLQANATHVSVAGTWTLVVVHGVGHTKTTMTCLTVPVQVVGLVSLEPGWNLLADGTSRGAVYGPTDPDLIQVGSRQAAGHQYWMRAIYQARTIARVQ